MTTIAQPVAAPLEVFPLWVLAQREAAHLAREPLPAPWELRTTAYLTPDLAQQVSDWYTGVPTAPDAAVHSSYHALGQETTRLWQVIRRALGVRVQYTRGIDDPYVCAADLCADLRRHRVMKLR